MSHPTRLSPAPPHSCHNDPEFWGGEERYGHVWGQGTLRDVATLPLRAYLFYQGESDSGPALSPLLPSTLGLTRPFFVF